MKCEICQQAEAEMVVRVTIEGHQRELFVCHACSGRREEAATDAPDGDIVVEILFGAAFVAAHEALGRGLTESNAPCSVCGMSYREFRKRNWLGCAACYDHFAKALAPVLRDMHTGVRHVGKVPRCALVEAKREQLKAELAAAVEQQRFEQAATLRDELQELERRVSQVTEGQHA